MYFTQYIKTELDDIGIEWDTIERHPNKNEQTKRKGWHYCVKNKYIFLGKDRSETKKNLRAMIPVSFDGRRFKLGKRVIPVHRGIALFKKKWGVTYQEIAEDIGCARITVKKWAYNEKRMGKKNALKFKTLCEMKNSVDKTSTL